MCELSAAEQQAFDDACCAFAQKENLSALERTLSMRAATLRNKLNPSQPAKLTVIELTLITRLTGNHVIVDSLLKNLSMVGANIDAESTHTQLAVHALKANKVSGELSDMALHHANARHMVRTERERLKFIAYQGIRNLVSLVNTLEVKTAGIQPEYFKPGTNARPAVLLDIL